MVNAIMRDGEVRRIEATSMHRAALCIIGHRMSSGPLASHGAAQDRAYAYLAFLGVSITCVMLAALLTVTWAPSAAGSGLPPVKAFLNGVHVKDILKWNTLVAKTIGVTLVVSSGLPLGREGPMVHCETHTLPPHPPTHRLHPRLTTRLRCSTHAPPSTRLTRLAAAGAHRRRRRRVPLAAGVALRRLHRAAAARAAA